MTTQQIVIDRLKELPDYMHFQVIDYLEYLIYRQSIIEKENGSNEISEAHKQILIERYEKHKTDPNAGDEWDIVKQRLLKN